MESNKRNNIQKQVSEDQKEILNFLCTNGREMLEGNDLIWNGI